MKIIGLLGGTSWPSTNDYLAMLNRMVQERLGGFHSAEINLYSIDYHDIKSNYAPETWHKVPALLCAKLERLALNKPDCMLIANNTLHKAFDEVAGGKTFNGIPFIHIVDETGKEANARCYKKVLLLGTKFTMEDGYYASKLKNDFGLSVTIPDKLHRNQIQAAQTKISDGQDPAKFEAGFARILAGYKDFDAVILGCTELPLVVSERNTTLPILNPTFVQCRAAVDFALGS